MEKLLMFSAANYFATTLLGFLIVVLLFFVFLFFGLLHHASDRLVKILDWTGGIILISWSLCLAFYIINTRSFGDWQLFALALFNAIIGSYFFYRFFSRKTFNFQPYLLILSGGLFSLILALIYGYPQFSWLGVSVSLIPPGFCLLKHI